MRFLLTLLFVLSCSPAFAATETLAKQAYIVDATTGAVLLEKDADKRMPTASMSKLMTTAVVYDAIHRGETSLSDKFTVSEKAWKMGGSKMFVELGAEIPVEDLIKGVVVQSGNDATIVLAEGVAGTEDAFALRMNQLAARYGLKNSHFMNASGWPDPDHYSSPRDLAIITWHIMADYPEDYKFYAIPEFTWHGIKQPNRNPLLGRVQGADGMKTGHTEEAGYGLVGSAQRNGRRVIMVLSGMTSMKEREEEGVRMMEWALKNFRVAKLLKAGQVVGHAPVVYGTQKSIPLVMAKDAVSTVPATFDDKNLNARVRFMTPLVAPIKKGARVGSVVVTIPGMQAQEYPLLAGADSPLKGFFGLTLDKILQAAK